MLGIALLIAAAVAPSDQDSARPNVDKALIEKFRALTPEQKARLKERVEALRKLSPTERHRLSENLDKFRALAPERQKVVRERLEKMSPEERRKTVELAAGFFRWMNARYGPVKFPRQAFFRWAAAKRTAEFQGLKDLEPGPRVDALLRLAHDYRTTVTQQLRQHVLRHGCDPDSRAASLDDKAFEDFWVEAEDIGRKCPKAPKVPAPKSQDKR